MPGVTPVVYQVNETFSDTPMTRPTVLFSMKVASYLSVTVTFSQNEPWFATVTLMTTLELAYPCDGAVMLTTATS